MRQDKIESLVQDTTNDICDLSSQIKQLRAVQHAVARLMEDIDEITHKKWHEDSGMAYLSILELEKKVRLIDLGFYPLFTKIQETSERAQKNSHELHDILFKQKGEFLSGQNS